MATKSAGLLAFRKVPHQVEFLLVHPGGPFFAKKDAGSWSIPKGLREESEDSLAAARREFAEETSFTITNEAIELGHFKQSSGKIIEAWLVEADLDVSKMASNSFTIEWPPKTGRQQEFPEVDRYGWFNPKLALEKVSKGQQPILQAAMQKLGVDDETEPTPLPPLAGGNDPQGSLF